VYANGEAIKRSPERNIGAKKGGQAT